MKKRTIICCGIVLLAIVLIGFCTIYYFNKEAKNQFTPCEFIRTYKIENILESNDSDYYFVTIRAFQNEDVETIKIKSNMAKIVQGNNYEFKFKLKKKINDDSIQQIYQNSDIITIAETTKTGLEQINDNLCSK